MGSAAAVSTEAIHKSLMAALNGAWPRACGHGLTDGWGVARLATTLLGLQQPLLLRPAVAADEALWLRWANDPQVRDSSFSPEPIAPADHKHWFQSGLAGANRLLLIARVGHGCPLGQIRFDRQPPAQVPGPREALIGLSLVRCVRGQGQARELLRLGLQGMEHRWGPCAKAVAKVLAGNTASQATFARAGFRLETVASAPPVSACDALALASSRLTLLSDASSWFNDHLPRLIEALWQRGHAVRWIHHPTDLAPGDGCLLLSCGRLLSPNQLVLHRHNLVVHESALPKGQAGNR